MLLEAQSAYVQYVTTYTPTTNTYTPKLCVCVCGGGMCGKWSSGMGVFWGVVCICGVHMLVHVCKLVC